MTDGGNTESSRFGILRKRVEERLNINDDTLEHFGVNPGILPLRYKRRKAAEDVRMELKYAVDSLTGLLSKDFFNETIKTSVAQAERDLSMSPLGLAIIDIDHFGKFNKDFGIPTGDEVLASVGDAMHTKMRSSDTGYRIDGEELAVITYHTQDPKQLNISEINALPEKMRLAIMEAKSKNNHSVTASVGFAEYIHGEETDSFIQRSNDALIVAKKRGRNRTVIAEVKDRMQVFRDLSTNTLHTVIKGSMNQVVAVLDL